MLFGHSYRPITTKIIKGKKGEHAKREYDEFLIYRCSRCGREIGQEEEY